MQPQLRLTIQPTETVTIAKHNGNYPHAAAHKITFIFHPKAQITYRTCDITTLCNPIKSFSSSTIAYTKGIPKIAHWQSSFYAHSNRMEALLSKCHAAKQC